ncbi:MAG: ABC transporter ATP-binding protein [Clostridiales bacterium]|nr:ABC transporter ATP-binding protein [Clostridiales bacterium]
MDFFNKYVKKYYKFFLLAIFFLTAEALCDLIQPAIMSKIVDIGVKNKDIKYVLNMGGIMLMITAAGAVAACLRNVISSNVSQKFGAELRFDLYKKIQTYSFDNLNKFEGASLVTRLTNDVTQLQNLVNGMMRIFVKAPLLCIGSFIMALRLNPKMSIIILAVMPVISMLIWLNLKLGLPFFVKVQDMLDRVNGVMREYLAGVRVVKAFNRFEYETGRFNDANSDLGAVTTKVMRIMAIFSPSIRLTINIAIVAVLYIGGIKVNSNSMQVGEIIAFINYMTQILYSLMMITMVFTMFVRAKASAERIGEVFEQEDTINDIDYSAAEALLEKGRIDFEHVCFSYSGASGQPVIKDITFSCMPGETIGIIGSTGSGKSTLLSLVPRFYDPTSGNVRVDGINVKNIDTKKLREKISVVPQKTVLFTGSIIDNIRWGRDDASYEEVEEAAEVAQIGKFVSSLPEGFNTFIGQGGVNFSGGQKQRISIARAIVRKPEILILDDCTSAVDTNTESKIKEALKRYSKGLTCLIVAQRITSVMDADKIVVLDGGKVAGIGSHKELLSNCEIYRDIFHSQIGKEMTGHDAERQ